MTGIAYYRVSSKKQEDSGLGLDAQKVAVETFCQQNRIQVLAKYVEVETGKNCNRPQVRKAIGHTKRAKAKLIVAKLDRLARNVLFTAQLMQSKVPFVCCDNPHANEFTIHILAAVAQHERQMISDRTRAAMAEFKVRGGVIGGRRLTDADRKLGTLAAAAARSKAAREAYEDLKDSIEELTKHLSNEDVAAVLNMQGHRTRAGKMWNSQAVWRVKKLFERWNTDAHSTAYRP
jgi:DNA invertase Pin-like site-specific DNA recombinase